VRGRRSNLGTVGTLVALADLTADVLDVLVIVGPAVPPSSTGRCRCALAVPR
jgi:hypothetical protein